MRTLGGIQLPAGHVRQCTRLPREDDVDIVAGLELKEFELE